MLKHKLVQAVPSNAVNIAFVRNSSLKPAKNVSLLDLSPGIPTNYAYVEKDRAVQTNRQFLATQYAVTLGSEAGVVFSGRSVMHPDVREPRPLYYKHILGAGPRQSGTRRYVLLSNSAAFDLNECRLELRKSITVLDDSGAPAVNINWDLEVEGFYSEGGEDIGFNVVVWTDRRNYAGSTYHLKYGAYDTTTGEVLPNHVEVLNTAPMPYGDDDYHLVREAGYAGYHVDLLGAVTYSCVAPGIAVFPPSEGASGWLHTPTGGLLDLDIIVYDSDGNPNIVWQPADGEITVRDLVALINKYPYFRATCLTIIGDQARLTPGDFIPVYDGTIVPLTGNLIPPKWIVVHYRHRLDRRIVPKLPVERVPYRPWYPRISRGEFVELDGWEYGAVNPMWYAECVYTIPEIYSKQDYSLTYGPGIREVADESITVLNDRSLQVQRYPIHDFDSIRVTRDDKDVIIPKDADLIGGKIYFDVDIANIAGLKVSYAYEADYEYTDINLNPVLLHNPDILGKYVGIYLMPEQIRITQGDPGPPGSYPNWAPHNTDVVYLEGYSVTGGENLGLSEWELCGLVLRGNTSCDCKLYLTWDAVSLRVYKDEARTELVGQAAAGGAPGDCVKIMPRNNSGLYIHALIGAGGGVLGDSTLTIEDARKCVRHVVGDSVDEVREAVENIPPYIEPTSGHEITCAKLIGVYQVTQTSTVSEVTTLDTRTRGGGVHEGLDVTELEETRMNFDIGWLDGESYQSAGAVIVNMPTGITPGTGIPPGELSCHPNPSGWEAASNNLTRDEIDGKISKHIALGLYPLLEYYER